jgi:hypothetical protein
MSLSGPETSEHRRSGQAAMKQKLPFVSNAAIGSSEPSLIDAAMETNVGLSKL